MRWPGIEQIYGPHLQKTSVFSSPKLWEDLHTRVIEHVRPKQHISCDLVQLTVHFAEHSHCVAILHADNADPPNLSP